MADRGQVYTHSTVESDCIFDFFCELCKDDDINAEAVGYCSDCGEYICGECFKAHPRSRPTRYHKLLDKNEMPRDIPLDHDRLNLSMPSLCKLHAGKPVEFYCVLHDFMGCPMCCVTIHRNCPKLENIREKSTTILDSSELVDFKDRLKDLKEKSLKTSTLVRENKTSAERDCSEAVVEVRQFKADIIGILNELERSIISEAEKVMAEDISYLESIETNLVAISNTADQISSECERLQSSKRVCQLYIKMKESEKEVGSLEHNLNSIAKNYTTRNVSFKPNGKLKTYLRNSTVFGNLKVQRQTKAILGDHPMNMVVNHVANIDVNTTDDKACSITGTALFSERLLVVDNENSKVKLVDSKSYKFKSVLKVSSNPWDVAAVNRFEAAVTLPAEKKILLLRVADSLKTEREITVGGNCRGVAYSQNKLFVSFVDNPRLDIMDLQGNVIKRIDHGSDGKKLFSLPQYVCVNKSCSTIYVSDAGRGRVAGLSPEGCMKSVYKDNALTRPQKLCSGYGGNIYVCDYGSRTVHMLTGDVGMTKKIVKPGVLISGVWSVSYCWHTHRLFVGMNGSSKIVVFELH